MVLAAPAAAAAARPAFIPDIGDATILMLPGTGDRDGADQIARTAGVGWFGDASVANGRIIVVDYPAAFGFRALGLLVPVVGKGTYNESAAVGAANLVAEADRHDGRIVLNGFSQSTSPVMNAAYLLHQKNPGRDGLTSVVIGADPRFPKTGAEVVMPSFIPGLYTNGERNTADTGDIEVTSVCIIGDTTCGMANPLAQPVSWLFYFLPGFYVHGNMYDDAGDFTVVSAEKHGNTTFVVLDGGNPWGMMLRDVGLPVPNEFDELLNWLVPRQMPGQASTAFGQEVPTPRALQVSLYRALGVTMPVTDPDVVGVPGNSTTSADTGRSAQSGVRVVSAPAPAASAPAAPAVPDAVSAPAAPAPAPAAPAVPAAPDAATTPPQADSTGSHPANTTPWNRADTESTPPWEHGGADGRAPADPDSAPANSGAGPVPRWQPSPVAPDTAGSAADPAAAPSNGANGAPSSPGQTEQGTQAGPGAPDAG